MSIRYMGTKQSLAPQIVRAIAAQSPKGRVVDLFSGMGSVARGLAPAYPIHANDLLSFTSAFARARFLNHRRRPVNVVLEALSRLYVSQATTLRKQYRRRVVAETHALSEDETTLREWMKNAAHVGNSAHYRKRSAAAASSTAASRYCLTTLYFASSYFSTLQSIELDSIRFAIDRGGLTNERDWLLASWISAASAVINAPGHTAQFLKPTRAESFARIRRTWKRSVWAAFSERAHALPQEGDRSWRSQNRVSTRDAIDLLGSDDMRAVGLVYADPPYTKDHYSRYYHVFETLFLYDFPASEGTGRYRAGRFATGFSRASEVKDSFGLMLNTTAAHGVPLVLSYPSNGLLVQRGIDLQDLLRTYFRTVRSESIEHSHSTMGASSGAHRKVSEERIYSCVP